MRRTLPDRGSWRRSARDPAGTRRLPWLQMSWNPMCSALRPELLPGKDGGGFARVRELLFRSGVASIDIGMIRARQSARGLADFVVRRSPSHVEDVIIVAELDSPSSCSPVLGPTGGHLADRCHHLLRVCLTGRPPLAPDTSHGVYCYVAHATER